MLPSCLRAGISVHKPQARRCGQAIRRRVHEGANSVHAHAAQDADGWHCDRASAGKTLSVTGIITSLFFFCLAFPAF